MEVCQKACSIYTKEGEISIEELTGLIEEMNEKDKKNR